MSNDNAPMETNFHDSRARKYGPGVTLFTRDGDKQGNAIIVRETKPKEPHLQEYLKNNGNQKMWVVETDFGNRMNLCDREVDELYMIGRPDNYDRWWNARMDLIQKTVGQ